MSEGTVCAFAGFSFDRRDKAARSACGRVPDTANATQSPADTAANSYGGRHQPFPAEGKSFAAVNLALAEAQLEGNPDFAGGLRLPSPDRPQPVSGGAIPGLTDYLTGKARLEDCIKRIANTNLYILPAGEAVINPLEFLNLREMKHLLDQLPRVFNWVILDSPPLLFAADANLFRRCVRGPCWLCEWARLHRFGHPSDAVALSQQCPRDHCKRRAPRRTVLEVHVLSQLLLREARKSQQPRSRPTVPLRGSPYGL